MLVCPNIHSAIDDQQIRFERLQKPDPH